MKRLIGITILWSLGLFLNSGYGQGRAMKAEVWDVFGPATYSLPGGPPRRLGVGTALPPGAVVKTGVGAAVDLHLGKEAGLIRMTQNSILTLDKMESANGPDGKSIDVQVTVMQGTILGNLRKLSPSAKFEVKVANGVVSLREGQYRISSEGYLVLLGGNLLFAYVPANGEPALHTLTGPPGVYFSPVEERVRPAPPELVREVQRQLQARLRGP